MKVIVNMDYALTSTVAPFGDAQIKSMRALMRSHMTIEAATLGTVVLEYAGSDPGNARPRR